MARKTPVSKFAPYKIPVRDKDGYWRYRRGGYNPADGTYGRCTHREDALSIIQKRDVIISPKEFADGRIQKAAGLPPLKAAF